MNLPARIRSYWEEHWFRPEDPWSLALVRFVVSLNALWIVLSRPGLSDVLGWPSGFLDSAQGPLLYRFGLGLLPPSIEGILYQALPVLLLAAAFGLRPRITCLASGLLLYHFAPLENIIWHHTGPYFYGLTLPTLVLIALSVADSSGGAPSAEYRWPVALARLLISFNYSFAAISKLNTAGWAWVSAENIRGMILTSLTWEDPPRFGAWLIDQPGALWFIAVSTMTIELLFFVVPFSRRLQILLVPAAAIGHYGIVHSLGIVFLAWPSLAVYIDGAWLRRIVERVRRR